MVRRRLQTFGLLGILATVLFTFVVTGSACSNGGAAISGSPGGALTSIEIPAPGASASYTPPRLPERGPSVPPDTIPLETVYHQGAADVLRGLLDATSGGK